MLISRTRYSLLLHFAGNGTSRSLSKRYSQIGITQENPFKNGPSDDQVVNRISPINIQMLPPALHAQLFPHSQRIPTTQQINIARKHLSQHNLLNKPTSTLPDVDLKLPTLLGSNLDEHFRNMALGQVDHILSEAKRFSDVSLLPPPQNWSGLNSSGWTRWDPRTEEWCAESPPSSGETIVLDVEVLVKVGFHPVIAIAASTYYWYVWVAPCVFNLALDPPKPQQLIELGTHPRLVIGHHVAFDRARIKEQYFLRRVEHYFLDTMSLHSCVGGLCNQQKALWTKYNKQKQQVQEDGFTLDGDIIPSPEIEDEMDPADTLWFRASSRNSLKEVARLYCKLDMDKEIRNVFVDGSMQDVRDQLPTLLSYCAQDVWITHKVYRALFPKFLEKCPHPVTFSGMLQMGSSFLPTNERWEEYIKKAEEKYTIISKSIEKELTMLAMEALTMFERQDPSIYSDPWLKHLDWHATPIKMTTAKYKKDGKTFAKNGEPRPYKNQFLPGKPQWFRDAWDRKANKLSVTIRSRIAPYLFRLKWMGYPIYYSKQHGWLFRVPRCDHQDLGGSFCTRQISVEFNDEEKENIAYRETRTKQAFYYKIPHKDGDEANCGSPLSKSYTKSFENGILSSEYSAVKEALHMNTLCAYWISSRDRVKSQFPLWQDPQQGIDLGLPESRSGPMKQGIILPQVCVMGTVTRRAVEPTWMTASNAKNNRIGSELKSQIQAPPGYAIVGADVDSEELWISSVLGDSQLGLHGGSALGWMTLQGTKSAGTDLHSVTANILGISRDQAKVFNYGRIYGAGEKFASQLLQQFNPSISPQDAQKKAKELYQATKGAKWYRSAYQDRLPKEFWYGGSESLVFNRLEEIAWHRRPTTPVLGCGITEALTPRNTKSKFLTSRVNWVVQSSGVDYLHLLLVAMDYLIRKYRIDARFMISVHDELRYLVKDEDVHRAALALQISNIWTRCMFAYKIGMDDLPFSVAFFSAVDVDSVLRKEVNMDCVTPSNPTPLPNGKAYSIYDTLQQTHGSLSSSFPRLPTLYSLSTATIDSRDSSKGNAGFEKETPVNKVREDNVWLLIQTAKSEMEISDYMSFPTVSTEHKVNIAGQM